MKTNAPNIPHILHGDPGFDLVILVCDAVNKYIERTGGPRGVR